MDRAASVSGSPTSRFLQRGGIASWRLFPRARLDRRTRNDAAASVAADDRTKGSAVIRRARIRQGVRLGLVVAFVVGLLWLVFEDVDPAALGRAMDSAARQRELTP